MTIFDKSIVGGTQKACILQPSEIFNIQTNIQDWSEFIVVAQLAVTGLSGNNDNLDTVSSSETLLDNVTNNFYYGLIDTTETLPSINNNFVGAIGSIYRREIVTNSHSFGFSSTATTSSYSASVVGGAFNYGTLFNSPSTAFRRIASTASHVTSDFTIRAKIRFVVNNKNSASQTISYYFDES